MSGADKHHQMRLPRIDDDTFYSTCLTLLLEKLNARPPLSSLHTDDLLWSATVSYAHGLEIVLRVLAGKEISDQHRVQTRALQLMLETLPRKDELYNLWNTWDEPHRDWPLSDTLLVPMYFSLCQLHRFDCILEVRQRLRRLQRPVFKAWMELKAGAARPDKARLGTFLGAMDSTLQTTVRRRLQKSSSPITDEENVALLGAIESEQRGRKGIFELFHREGAITTDSGECIKIPTIPPPPVRGMEQADEMGTRWRAFAHDSAFKLCAALAPGTQGLLETALSDAAHAAQRAQYQKSVTKKRGGSGGVKSEQAGTADPPAQHVQFGDPERDPGCIDPSTLIDDRLNPEQQYQKHENEAADRDLALAAFRTAVERWGPSGKLMLQALSGGLTDKAAAEAAGITPQALRKRMKTLKNILDR
jgi:hypothetical protein